jgi:hypothetical protein
MIRTVSTPDDYALRSGVFIPPSVRDVVETFVQGNLGLLPGSVAYTLTVGALASLLSDDQFHHLGTDAVFAAFENNEALITQMMTAISDSLSSPT